MALDTGFDMHNKQDQNEFKREQASLKKSLNIGETIEIERDSRRQISNSEKEEIWNNSRIQPNFDPKFFRKDILGNVCVKNLCLYRSFSARNQISYQYEHIRSYSNGGKTNTENVCLLNSGINNMKRTEEIFKIDYMKAFGYCKFHGISFEDLESQLDKNIHLVCDKYNLYFYKDGYRWSIKEYTYNNEYRSKHLDKQHGDYIGEKIMDSKNFLYDNKKTLLLTFGLGLLWCSFYYLGDKRKKDSIFEVYLTIKNKLKELNKRLRLLKYEIEEINDETIYRQKMFIIMELNEEIYRLQNNISKLCKILNISQ